MTRELKFKNPSFYERLRGMLGVDFYRLFYTPLFYIFLAIAAIIPAMILGTGGMENPQTGEISAQLYTNLWHIIAAESPLYSRVEEDEAGYLRVYDLVTPELVVNYLYENNILVSEIKTDKIGLEEYYIDLMKGGRN